MTEDLNRGVSQDAGAEAEGAEGASFTGTEGSEQLLGQASVMVARPDPGQTVEISAEPGQTYVLDFDPSEARALVEGDNLILVFEDGSKIVFENLVDLAQLENGPSIQYAGQDMIAMLQAQGSIPGVLDAFELIAPGDYRWLPRSGPQTVVVDGHSLGPGGVMRLEPGEHVAAFSEDVPGGMLVLAVAEPPGLAPLSFYKTY